MTIKEQLKAMSTDKLLEVYRKYCDLLGMKCHAYPMKDFKRIMQNASVQELKEAVPYLSYFNCDENYFCFDNGQLTSFNNFEDVYDLDALESVVCRNQQTFESMFDFTDDMLSSIKGNLSKCSYKDLKLITKIIEDITSLNKADDPKNFKS